MKISLFLSAFLLFSGFINSQAIAEFEFAPHDSIHVSQPLWPRDTIAIGDLEIHSLSPNDVNIRWQRNVLMITPGCGSQVCDLNACYPESFSTKTFVLGPGVTGPISVHLNIPENVLGQSVIRLDMWNVDIPDVIVTSYYLFNMDVSGVNNTSTVPEAKIFPNPTSDYFTIDRVEGLSRVRLLDLTGREVAAYNAASTTTFRIDNQPAGQYIVSLEDETGKIVAIAQLVKN